METITITLSEPLLQKLKERAKEAKVAPEELLRASVEEWLQRPKTISLVPPAMCFRKMRSCIGDWR